MHHHHVGRIAIDRNLSEKIAKRIGAAGRSAQSHNRDGDSLGMCQSVVADILSGVGCARGIGCNPRFGAVVGTWHRRGSRERMGMNHAKLQVCGPECGSD